ncbi:hypothetical protein BegalDRAFT_2409 [Beggiatoa alba B18LD]|uniref:N(2)-fixation sustaining protein CowN n=1 Tax=Beggiatoa alba B18LD TaxID=395493 RepID=I3CI17_9GAMM|nr:N(2)-fixation sustaining protein CowN [Beggiatoa alba]EIJ43260.1 hypothetical protein BegalDRAFT_2409 [Beggiatoa alba B18LD]
METNSNSTTVQTDRYISFLGISCDANADQLLACVEAHIEAGHGDARWHVYFQQKRVQQAKMQHDNLYFVGSQMNNLRSYLEQCQDVEALELLWRLEQECC